VPTALCPCPATVMYSPSGYETVRVTVLIDVHQTMLLTVRKRKSHVERASLNGKDPSFRPKTFLAKTCKIRGQLTQRISHSIHACNGASLFILDVLRSQYRCYRFLIPRSARKCVQAVKALCEPVIHLGINLSVEGVRTSLDVG
jgi:hypothetical protein